MMKNFNMIVMLFLSVDASCMEDAAMKYIKMEAAYPGYTELAIDERAKLKEFAKSKPEIIFDKFYDIFASSVSRTSSCHTFALLAALGQVCLSEAVNLCVIYRVCKHAAYLRAYEIFKSPEIKSLIDVADSITSCIPYAGMTLCVYSHTRTCIPLEIRQKTYDFVLQWLKKKECKNVAVVALLKFMSGVSAETESLVVATSQ